MIIEKKKSFVKKIKETDKEIELDVESTQKVTEEERELDFNQLRVEDIEKADRVKPQTKIKGLERTKRLVEQPTKLTISRTDNKYYASGAFDSSFMQMHTSEISYDLVQSELVRVGVITELVAEVNSGKEATIYTAHLKGSPLIVKAFRQQNTSHNRQKRRKTGNAQARAASYANREYQFLGKAFRNGVRIPTPAMRINNIIIMQFIGEDWTPAPQLRQAVLENPEEVLDDIIEQLRIMFQYAKIIHGDFSEYNLLFHDGKIVVIDMPQAIDMSLIGNISERRLKSNLQVLQQDIMTIRNYFEKEYNITFDFKEVYSYIAGKYARREKYVDLTIEEMERLIDEQKMGGFKKDSRDTII
ncbi:MAG: RIO1 family regulatory kinase/ATPase domain-containing protein [Candidatus Heimdallarchaeota archaeon]